MHAGGEHAKRKGMKGAESVREKVYFEGHRFIRNKSSIKRETEEPGDRGNDKKYEEKV